MQRFVARWLIRAAWLVSSMVLTASGIAQQVDDGGLQEIVVTAQREAQNVLSVPMSIQAVSGEQLAQQGITGLTDLQFTVPGYLPSNASGYTQIYIRGVGNSIFVGADPSVATFIDDVPRIYGSMSDNLVDVDRVEVLKGAQGGLYGRNATGGVVNIITHQPNTDKLEGSALVDYGEMNSFRIAGYANAPLGDRVALMVSAERSSHAPYVDNIASHDPYTAAMFPGGSNAFGGPQDSASAFNSFVRPYDGYNDSRFWAVSSKLLVEPADHFKVTLAADYNYKKDTNGTAAYDPTPEYTQTSLAGIIDALAGANIALPPGFISGKTQRFTSALGSPNYTGIRDYGISMTAVWNAPGFDLTSITANRSQVTTFFDELCSCNVPELGISVLNHKGYFYQELRAASTLDGPLHLLGGATFLRDHFQGNDIIDEVPPAVPYFPTGHTLDLVRNWSVYLQVGYDVTHALNLTASARYIHESNHADFIIPAALPAGSSEKKFLPSATLSYKFDGGGNVYGRWARGFKAGGVNPLTSPASFTNPNEGGIFGGETVDTYEIGYRAPLLNRDLQVTTAVFYNKYRNLQVTAHALPQYAAIAEAIVNADSARTWGAEETLDWRLFAPLTVSVSAGYLNAKYTNFALANSAQLEPFDLSGSTMLNSPKLQANFRAEYQQSLNGQLRLVANALEAYVSHVLFAQSGLQGVLPDAVGPGYWLTNLRLGIQTTDEKYSAALYAKNLFKREYYTYGSSAAAYGNLLDYGDPRIIGGEITARF